MFSSFVLLGLVLSALSQDIGWEERLRNDLFYVEWDVKPYSVQFAWAYPRVHPMRHHPPGNPKSADSFFVVSATPATPGF